EWYKSLSGAARKQFLAHEIKGHLDHPDWTEDQVKNVHPIGLVLSESVMALSQIDLNLLKQAEQEIEAYLTTQYDDGVITSDIYEEALKNTYANLDAWVKDTKINSISPNTRVAIFEAIRQERWTDIIEVFRKDITFGTAGIRGMAALSEEELNILNQGPLAPILKGPNTINDIVLLLKTAGVIKYAKKHGLHKVAIGYDSRINGKKFAEMIAQSFIGSSTKKHSFTVYLFDEASPFPELSFGITTKEVGADLGILISASHNPSNYNGYKITDHTGAQLSGKMRKGIVDAISTITPLDIKLKPMEEATEGQLRWLGGKAPIAKYDYKGVDVRNPEYFIDMHTLHVNQVEKFIIDGETVKEFGPEVSIGFSAYNGAGNKAVPRLLKEVGFTNGEVGVKNNVKPITDLQELDGRFPAFKWGEQPDPGDPIAAKKAVEMFVEEYGQEAFDKLDILIGTDPDADRAGIIVKIPNEQQHLFGEYKLLSANDAWTLLLWYRWQREIELSIEKGLLAKVDDSPQKVPNAENRYITFTHVTTDALERVADLFGVRSLGKMSDMNGEPIINYLDEKRVWVGFTGIAEFCKEMRKRGLINDGGAEESNGFSILGGVVPSGEILAEDGHINDKDGVFAAVLLAEAAAYAKFRGTTLFELLDNIYMNPKVGYFATANKPLPRVGSFEGAEGVSKKIELLKTSQEWMKEANERKGTSNPFIIAGLPVIGAVEFKTGKYDENHYPGFPDEGIRFFFADENLKSGEPFSNSKNYITIRPSGTSQTIRFYTQLFANVNQENLVALKYKTSRRAEALALQAQLQLLNAAGYKGDVANIDMILKQMTDAGYVPEEVIYLIQGKEIPTAKSVMENARRYSGLPVSSQNITEPETKGRTASEIWSEAFSQVDFDEEVYYRAERVGDAEERATGITAFASVAEDTDIKPLTTYPKDHHEGLVRSGEKMQQVLMDKNAETTPEAY
ncbi:MAG: hypothetical protein HQ579_03400, partial [Candidatus Omnitrophica bacterium]|nr:hypothetical protein [Candidatus Omnitrophota bacterium]